MTVKSRDLERPDPLVLHVLPYDEPRGVQVYGQALRDALDGVVGRHRLLTLFSAPSAVLREDFTLGVERGSLRRAGFDPRCVTRLRRLINELSPRLIVAHGGEPLKYLVPAGPRCPIVYYAIGVVHTSVHSGFRRSVHRWLAGRAEVVAGVSEEVLEDARVVLGVPRERMVLIPNGRDATLFRPRLSAPGNPPKVVFIGELDATKRPDWFVKAVAALRRRGLDLDAELIGGGEMQKDLEHPALEAGVKLLGPRSDIPDRLDEADILLFTGRPPEGMPGVLIEAGLAGLPVVTTKVPGAATVVEDGVTGYLVDIDDFDSLVEAVDNLLRNGAARRELGVAARDRCRRLFSMEASVACWIELLRRLMPDDAEELTQRP